MAIDYDSILSKFIDVAVQGVGSQLSLINGQYPAVIRSRQDAPKPDYPYIVLDILQTNQENGWLFAETVTDAGFLSYETHYEMLLSYTVYGDNAASIANQLEGFFRLSRIRNEITNDVAVGVVNTNPVISIPQLLVDKYVEASSFTLVTNVSDVFVDDSQECVIDSIDLDGELARGVGDPAPIAFNIIAP